MTTCDTDKAEAELKKIASKVKEDDVKKIIDKQREIEEKFSGSGPLGKFIADVKTLFSLVGDYYNGNYKDIPWWSIASIVAALVYVLNPFDMIPDVIPIVGQVDDALVVAACFAMIHQDLEKYKNWKIKNA